MDKKILEKNLLEMIEDIYDAEVRIVKALPKMVEGAADEDLKIAFKKHLKETEQHVARLENVFKLLGESPSRKTCQGIKGLVKEGQEILDKKDISPSFKDACIIVAAQKIEHYEIASYVALCSLVKQLSYALSQPQTQFDKIYNLLGETLDEEKNTNLKLTVLAEGTKGMQGIKEEAEKEIMSCCG